MRRVVLALFTGPLLASVSVAQARTKRQDSTLNNLAHEPAYETAPLGTIGRVEVRGSGSSDVLLIPGWGFGAEVFEQFMQANSAGYRMVAVSLPGFGGTSAPPMPPPGTSYGDATWMRAATEALVNVIRTHQLRKPVVIGHFLVGSQIAVHLAAKHPDLVGGLIIVGGEPMRGVAPGRPPISRAARAAFVDTALAPKWFKTVTRETFDANNYKAFWYATDSTRAAFLWKQSAAVPLAVMIRYLCEYTAMDTMDDFARLAVNTRILIPGFPSEFRADSSRKSAMNLFVDAWDLLRGTNPFISIDIVPDARTFITDDQPDAIVRAIRQVTTARN